MDVNTLHRQLKLAVERRTFEKALFFKPYPRQLEFMALGATHNERLLMAGNRLGKSECGAYEVACHLTGLYPAWWTGRRWNRPVMGWMSGTSAASVRDIAQEKLCGPPGNAEMFGSGMIPREAFISKPTISRSASNAFDTIRVRHVSGGISIVGVKTYEQERQHWQGVGLDFIWFDEEPPEDLYTEGRTRLHDKAGMSLMTFTPLFGMSEVVTRFLDEDAPNRVYVKMGINDALHFSPERRAEIIAEYPVAEREARVNGDPLLGSGKVYGTPEDDIRVPRIALEALPVEWTKIWGIDFGIDHPFAAALLAFDREENTTYILRTIRMTGAVPVQHAAAMKEIAANVPVAWPHDGHQRGKGDGLELAQLYKREGLNILDTHATMPTGGYGLYGSVTALDAEMQKRKVKVDDSCTEFFSEYGQYHYKDGKIVAVRDDVLSAVRCGWMMRRRAKPVPLGSKKPKIHRLRENPKTNPWTGRPVYATG